MKIAPFQLERYFARYEFSARFLLCSSDCDGLAVQWLLARADEQCGRLWRDLRLGYTESSGLPLLREQVARLYRTIVPDQVLIAAPEEGIFLALHALLAPGDHVICMFPGYQSLYAIAGSIGCQVSSWMPDENAGWRFELGFLDEAVRPNTKLLIINSPHNPTGSSLAQADLNGIIAFARERGIYVFADEMYRLLEHDPVDRLPPACDLYDRAISLFGMSKTFGMAGVRLGWVVTQDQAALAAMAQLKDYTTICSSAPSEILSLIALRIADEIVAMHLARIRRNLELLDAFFARRRSLATWVRPRAGTIGFPRLNLASSSFAFCERLVSDAGVLLLPSSVYEYDDRHVRIGFGRENMPEALAALDRYIEDQGLAG